MRHADEAHKASSSPEFCELKLIPNCHCLSQSFMFDVRRLIGEADCTTETREAELLNSFALLELQHVANRRWATSLCGKR